MCADMDYFQWVPSSEISSSLDVLLCYFRTIVNILSSSYRTTYLALYTVGPSLMMSSEVIMLDVAAA
jgi:hypothetical protein